MSTPPAPDGSRIGAALARVARIGLAASGLLIAPLAAGATPKPPPPPLVWSAPTTPPAPVIHRGWSPLSRRTPVRNDAPDPAMLAKLIPTASPGTVSPAEAGVEFSGYLRAIGSTLFVLTDVRRDTSSDLLTVGQSFAGFTVVEFEGANEVLAVRSGEKILRLPLKESRVRLPASAREAEIVVDAEGRFFVGGEKTPSADLRWRLENLAANLPNVVFDLVVIWPRDADADMIQRLTPTINAAVMSLPPEIKWRYPTLSWKVDK